MGDGRNERGGAEFGGRKEERAAVWSEAVRELRPKPQTRRRNHETHERHEKKTGQERLLTEHAEDVERTGRTEGSECDFGGGEDAGVEGGGRRR